MICFYRIKSNVWHKGNIYPVASAIGENTFIMIRKMTMKNIHAKLSAWREQKHTLYLRELMLCLSSCHVKYNCGQNGGSR